MCPTGQIFFDFAFVKDTENDAHFFLEAQEKEMMNNPAYTKTLKNAV
jgi:hypothetical protein